MSTNSENIKPKNVTRPASAPAPPAAKTPAKKYTSSSSTPRSLSRPTSASKNTIGTPVSTREAAIMAKAKLTAEKQKKTSMLKEKWAKEKQEKKEQIAKRRQEEMKSRQALSDLASKNRKKNIEKSVSFKKSKKERERELLRSSVKEHIEAKKKMEEAEKQRRRQSIMINNEILSRAKKNEAKLQRIKKEEEDSLFMTRRIDFLSVREHELEQAEKRRQSAEAKNAYCRMQSALQKELDNIKKEQIQDIFSVRKEMFEDDTKARASLRKSRRESLVARLDLWRTQRNQELEMKQKDQEKLQLQLIQRHEDWLDVQEAKKEYKDRERQSILWRLDKWRETKDLELQEAMKKQIAEDTERDLFLQEYEDVLQYKQEQEDLRRQSLAYRLDQASREKEWERGEQYVHKAEVDMERKITEEDRLDISEYKTKLEQDRRESLAFRLEKGLKDKEYEDGQTANEKAILAKEYSLKLADSRAINEYRETMKQKERLELANSIAESQKRKEKALAEHREMLDKMHDDFESRLNDWRDVNAHKAHEKERSRQSICLRLDSWRQSRLAAERQKAKQKLLDERDAEMRAADRVAMRNAEAQRLLDERAKNVKCFL